jgi:hypothetical protein
MYPRFLWEQIADLLGSAEHTLGTNGPEDFIKEISTLWEPIAQRILSKR